MKRRLPTLISDGWCSFYHVFYFLEIIMVSKEAKFFCHVGLVFRPDAMHFAAYDNPAALNRPLQEYLGHDYDLWQYELNLLYSVYSFPNMFLPFLGGQLVDRLDPKKILLLFSALVCAGQTLFAFGVSIKHFGTMLVGRVLFGIGGESISVVQASITTTWFRGKELAFALGLNLCIARFGSVVNANMSPRIAKLWDPSVAVWAGGLSCYMSFASAVALVIVIATHQPTTAAKKTAGLPTSSETEPISGEDRSRILRRKSSTFGEPAVTTPLLAKSPFPEAVDRPQSGFCAACINVWSEVSAFPYAFWLVCLICILLYGTVVPFNNIASDFLMSKWYPGDTQTAGTVMSIPDTMSALLVPACGIFVDRYGHRASLLILCSLVIAAVHLTLGLTMINPVFPLILLGLSYSIYGVAIWPSIATIIQHEEDLIRERQAAVSDSEDGELMDDPRLLGTAYGLSTSALNTALTIMPLMAARIRVVGGSFLPVELFFVGLALAGAVASIVLWVVDLRNGGILEVPEIHDDDDDDINDDEEEKGPVDENTPLLRDKGAGSDSGAGPSNRSDDSASSDRTVWDRGTTTGILNAGDVVRGPGWTKWFGSGKATRDERGKGPDDGISGQDSGRRRFFAEPEDDQTDIS
ncbi:hypothetical protein HK104_004794 [Borealophlyctis nickersoniae]|nr:hypothetical protein HK104_004794 [Borealophlyctis nickersoniae]